MKINGQKYETMKAAMWAVIDHAGGPEIIKDRYAKYSPGRMLWDVWHQAEDNLRYADNHPSFVSGQWARIVPQNPSFDVYSDDVNDRHIETTIKHIGKELGIIP